jgi:gluconokinase
MSLVLAVDLGTGSCRAALYTSELSQISSYSVEYATKYTAQDWAEQDPEMIYSGIIKAIQETIIRSNTLSNDISVLTIDCSVHTLLGIGEDKSPVTSILTWEDTRARNLVELWKRQEIGKDLYGLTGCPLHPMYSPAKIAWWRENQPDLFQKIRYFVTAKAFVIYRLTGELLEDQATVSGTGLLNIHKLDWEEEALRLAGISRTQMPLVVPPTYIIKKISSDICSQLGLSKSVRLVIGSSDAAMSSLGSGTIRPEQMTLMIGTSGAVRRIVDRPILDPQHRTFCYYSGNQKWFAGGAINNGGIVLRWFRDNFGHQACDEAEKKGVSIYSILSEYAGKVGPGADGLMFLPFLAGERAPYWNGNMRGIYFGVSLHHGQPAFVRALMEGVAFRMYSVCQPLNELIGEPQEIRVTGGFSRSKIWLQILADILGRELSVTGEPEGSVLGAAAFAYHALGELKSFRKLEEMNSIKQVVKPDQVVHHFYEAEFDKFLRIYQKNKDEFYI